MCTHTLLFHLQPGGRDGGSLGARLRPSGHLEPGGWVSPVGISLGPLNRATVRTLACCCLLPGTSWAQGGARQGAWRGPPAPSQQAAAVPGSPVFQMAQAESAGTRLAPRPPAQYLGPARLGGFPCPCLICHEYTPKSVQCHPGSPWPSRVVPAQEPYPGLPFTPVSRAIWSVGTLSLRREGVAFMDALGWA